MSWSINQVARMSGVTSRTLRHYDAIGLLKPAYVGANGYRYYERAQLLRLQRILLLRELGLSLEVIAKVQDRDLDEITALRTHRNALRAEHGRLARLLDTVDRTISELEGGDTVPAHDLFEGFDPKQYEAEAIERWGQEAVDASYEAISGWTKDDARRHTQEHTDICTELAALQTADTPVDDRRVQELVGRHYGWICVFWTPNAEAYRGLGQMYVDDERFTATYDAFAPGLARYLRDAIDVYARTMS